MESRLKELLKNNDYLGRGIILGKTKDSKKLAVAYFILGRSENSRNRVFEKVGDSVIIYPADESKLKDPSLIIYTPIKMYKKMLIVTNGNQTDTIYEGLEQGRSFENSLALRTFEPDEPNFTPRISGIANLESMNEYKLSILKSMDSLGKSCARYFYNYETLLGKGHLLHTYNNNEEPLPSFKGEPRIIDIPESAKELSELIWENLNYDNKISLYVRYIDSNFNVEDVLINKYKRV